MDHSAAPAPDHSALHARARNQGVNMLVYRIVRAVLVPFFKLYFRLDGVGTEHIPTEGGAIIAANHRSFLDPFIIGACAKRPLYFVAKRELFAKPLNAWILNSLGAFPVDRGRGDEQTIETAKAILERGDIVLIFPEGTRIRPGTLGRPKRGVGRLALESGVPVIPVAITGTEAIRRGWRIRPHKVRVRVGRALAFPQVQTASPQLAAAVTDRIWPCVSLQWEWLGGLAPIRRACVIGAGTWGTSLAVALAHAGYDVDLGCRTVEQARELAASRENPKYLPEVPLPAKVSVVATEQHDLYGHQLDLYGHDLICLAVPADAVPEVLAAHGQQIPRDAGVLVLSTGRVSAGGAFPVELVAARSDARAVAVAALGSGPGPGGSLDDVAVTVGSSDRGFSRQIADVLGAIGMAVTVTKDVRGLTEQLAGDGAGTQAA